MAVLGLLRRSTKHPTVIELHRRILAEQPNISRKTVYEVLDTLVEAGLALCIPDEGEPYRSETYSALHYHACSYLWTAD